jgi:hypothetical protein
MNEIKAIETHYDGYHFRSRLEARWAVFLNYIGVKYEYEKEGYKFTSEYHKLNNRWYLPDFWLPDFDCWLEIKGKEPTREEKSLCELLGQHTDKMVLLASGLPKRFIEIYCFDVKDSSAGTSWQTMEWLNYEGTIVLSCTCSSRESILTPDSMQSNENIYPRYSTYLPSSLTLSNNIYNIAKSARFE